MNNNELVKSGHELAKAISNDTPLIEIAKMVSNLATQLDVQIARSSALAAENTGLKAAHPQPFGPEMMKALDAYEKHQDETPETGMLDAFFILCDSIRVETPATDAFLAEVRAQGVEMLRDSIADLESSIWDLAADDAVLAMWFTGTHKAGVSKQDREASINWLAEYARQSAPFAVRRLAGKKFPLCMLIMAKFAYNDYASSAADLSDCPKCNGKGLLEKVGTVTKSHYTMRIPQWAKDLGQSPSSFEKKREVKNVEQSLCAKCNGTGKISKRCQCGGTGKTLDRKATELQGVPVYKECKRCEGRGYSRPKSSVAYRGIFSELPSLPDRTWRYSWKPFYEMLVSRCFQEESYSNTQLKKVTRSDNLTDIA